MPRRRATEKLSVNLSASSAKWNTLIASMLLWQQRSQNTEVLCNVSPMHLGPSLCTNKACTAMHCMPAASRDIVAPDQQLVQNVRLALMCLQNSFAGTLLP